MSSYRAPKAGLAKEESQKIESNFDTEEAKMCVSWLKGVAGDNEEVEFPEERRKAMDVFYNCLKDGMLLIHGVNSALPPDQKLDLNKKTFQITDNEIFKTSRERERIEIFLDKCLDAGVAEPTLFQIDCLYERTNLPQVMGTVRCLGIEAQTKPWYNGPRVWPNRSSELIEKLSRKPVREKKAPGLDIGIEFNVYKLPGGPPAPVQPRHHYPEPEPVVVHSEPVYEPEPTHEQVVIMDDSMAGGDDDNEYSIVIG